MKKDKHPSYQQVIFVDSATGKKFVCGTTAQSEQTEKHDGQELPIIMVPISASSHPFFVGGKQYVDTEGRVDRFKKRYERAQKQVQAAPEQPVEEKKKRTRTAKPKKTK